MPDQYLDSRQEEKSFFSYGLERRLEQVVRQLDAYLSGNNQVTRDRGICVADLGCADGRMLSAIKGRFHQTSIKATGIDAFEKGLPDTKKWPGIDFLSANLNKDYPLPIPDATVDFAIASAILKHLKSPSIFLLELERILKKGGRVILLDPVFLAVKIGIVAGYFEKRYTPFPWKPSQIRKMVSAEQMKMRLVEDYKYWLAPTRRINSSNIEKLVPTFIRRRMGVHQCVVLQKD